MAEIDEAKLGEFMGQLLGDMGGMVTIAMITLGDELGLYRAMNGAGPLTAAQLAEKTGTNTRLVQEWLDQQASAGYVVPDIGSGTFELPPEQALALAERDSPAFVATGVSGMRTMFIDTERIVEAFRGDGGFAWGDHHPSMFKGIAEFFRPGYRTSLVPDWLPSLDGVTARLEAGAAIADVGCGYGISSLLMADAFPNSTVTGFDYHPPSIEAATAAAQDAGMGDRATFAVAKADEFEGAFDLICFFDCLHDMGDPVGIAAHARQHLAPGGTVMLVEPFAHDDKATNYTLPTAKTFYGGSTMVCTPNSLSQPVGRGMGAQAGEAGMRAVFEEAGYSHFRRATETPFNIVYEARA